MEYPGTIEINGKYYGLLEGLDHPKGTTVYHKEYGWGKLACDVQSIFMHVTFDYHDYEDCDFNFHNIDTRSKDYVFVLHETKFYNAKVYNHL